MKFPSGRRSQGRRTFLKTSATAMAGLPFISGNLTLTGPENDKDMMQYDPAAPGSLIGQYGPWAASLIPDPPALSYRRKEFTDVDSWLLRAMATVEAYLGAPDIGTKPKVKVHRRYNFEELSVEEISWQLPYGRPTEAVVLKPKDARGPLPAMLGLHDHGGNKYLGKRKIIRTSTQWPDFIEQHQADYYGGRAWANELARRGYVVLVPDAFTFGSRRVMYKDVEGFEWGPLQVTGRSDDNPEAPENIAAYNDWAGQHEHVMSKSLFCAGTTWPGVFLREDQRALDVLCARKDVDAGRVACAGLSGGGLRTAYLGGLDSRIKAAVCVGFMSTWKDFILHKSYTHTWMTYIPVLPKYLDFPEILGLRVPKATMVLNNNQDQLFTLPEMKRADAIMQQVFDKAGAKDQYVCRFYEGPHKFDQQMQSEAFEWLEKVL